MGMESRSGKELPITFQNNGLIVKPSNVILQIWQPKPLFNERMLWRLITICKIVFK
jgi:hypothetical protein